MIKWLPIPLSHINTTITTIAKLLPSRSNSIIRRTDVQAVWPKFPGVASGATTPFLPWDSCLENSCTLLYSPLPLTPIPYKLCCPAGVPPDICEWHQIGTLPTSLQTLGSVKEPHSLFIGISLLRPHCLQGEWRPTGKVSIQWWKWWGSGLYFIGLLDNKTLVMVIVLELSRSQNW